MKEAIAFAERDTMDRKPLVHGVAGTNTFECIVSLRWFVTHDRNVVATFHRLAGQASRVNFGAGAPVGEKCVNDEGYSHARSGPEHRAAPSQKWQPDSAGSFP